MADKRINELTEIATVETDDYIPVDSGTLGTRKILASALSGGGGAGGIDYSTTERDTGLKWIDGNKIYQKTYIASSPINVQASGTDVTSEVDNAADMNVLISCETLNNGASKQCTNVWFGYDSGTLKMYCAEGMLVSHFTLRYTKKPDSADAIVPNQSITDRVTASQAAYVDRNWRVPSSVFNLANKSNNVNIGIYNNSSVYMYSTYETADRIDGCDWVRYDHDSAYTPYYVEIWANVSNAWAGQYPTVYLEFSNDGTDWDTLWTGIPQIDAGSNIYIPIETNNTYSKFRMRYNNGTGANGYEWCGCIANVQIYGTTPS